MEKQIYVADMDAELVTEIMANLDKEGYRALSFSDGEALAASFRTQPGDLLILGDGIGEPDSLTLIREIRKKSKVPIILLISNASDETILQCVQAGCDICLLKPFRMTVLKMQVFALLRRVWMERGRAGAMSSSAYGDLRYDAEKNLVLCGEHEIPLTQTEKRLLSTMLQHPEKCYSRAELLQKIWGYGTEVETRVTDETIRRVRKKMQGAGCRTGIRTVWGCGYQLMKAE